MFRKITGILLTVLLLSSCWAFTTTGPLFPTAFSGNTSTNGGGTRVWANPGNITAADGVFATVVAAAGKTDDLRGGTFGFTIAGTDTINGITLEVNAFNSNTNVAQFTNVVLEGGGGASADRSASTTFNTTATTFVFGGPGDLWGTTWTPSQINAAGFVGSITIQNVLTGSPSVDFMRITVTSTATGTGMGKRVIHSQTRTVQCSKKGCIS